MNKETTFYEMLPFKDDSHHNGEPSFRKRAFADLMFHFLFQRRLNKLPSDLTQVEL